MLKALNELKLSYLLRISPILLKTALKSEKRRFCGVISRFYGFTFDCGSFDNIFQICLLYNILLNDCEIIAFEFDVV
jgi:hypothetical protein